MQSGEFFVPVVPQAHAGSRSNSALLEPRLVNLLNSPRSSTKKTKRPQNRLGYRAGIGDLRPADPSIQLLLHAHRLRPPGVLKHVNSHSLMRHRSFEASHA